jgi:hypothetical protein
MGNYLKYEELPKNYRYYLDQIKELGVDDIRIVSVFNHDTKSSIFYGIWIDTEDVVDGKVPNADILRASINKMSPKMFGIDNINYFVKYKNKESFAKKFLPDLKRAFKNSKYFQMITSIKFDVNDVITPKVIVRLRSNPNLNSTYQEVLDKYDNIRRFLEDYKKENGLTHLEIDVK